MPAQNRLPLVALALLSALAGGCGSGDEKTSPAGPATRDNTLPVYTHTVEAAPLEEVITATGTVLADEAVQLTSEVAGLVTKVNFEEGARVAAGDLLFKTNDTELQAEFDRAKAGVSLARIQADRQKTLLKVQGASQEAYDVALNELKILEADAALIEARLTKTRVHAPFDGIVGLRHISEGTYLSPGAPVATLQKVDTLKVDFNVAERHMDRLRNGTRVEVRVTGVAEPVAATVYAIEPRIDESTRTIRLRARAENPEGRILPGAFATVRVPLRTIPDAILVPAAAIIPGLNQQTVYVVEDGKAAPRDVQTGVRLDRDIQITSGLQAGDVVITSGQLQVRPGTPVRPAKREGNSER
ncbi:MAG: efflux RND transporter periplasmic adaptor subunit [Verrucomicrobiota bacterium]